MSLQAYLGSQEATHIYDTQLQAMRCDYNPSSPGQFKSAHTPPEAACKSIAFCFPQILSQVFSMNSSIALQCSEAECSSSHLLGGNLLWNSMPIKQEAVQRIAYSNVTTIATRACSRTFCLLLSRCSIHTIGWRVHAQPRIAHGNWHSCSYADTQHLGCLLVKPCSRLHSISIPSVLFSQKNMTCPDSVYTALSWTPLLPKTCYSRQIIFQLLCGCSCRSMTACLLHGLSEVGKCSWVLAHACLQVSELGQAVHFLHQQLQLSD